MNMQKKWLILGIFILAIVLAVAGFYVWRTYIKITPVISNKTDQPVIAKTPEPVAPKIEKYSVPILMYHYIRVADPADTLGVALSVEPNNFASQMKWLKDNNYITIKLEDLADPQKTVLTRVKELNKKPVIVTFDDGYDNVYTSAFPVLKKYDYIATVFVIRDFVGRAEYATQPQLDKMASYGMEIGSHTLSHRDLAKNSLEVDHQQIFDSKLDAQVFCYPSGKYIASTIDLVKEAGYLAAVTTKPGIANQDSNLFELPRVRIKNFDLETFVKKIQGLE